MENISGVVGQVAISIGSKDYILDNFGFDDWSVFKSTIVQEKRSRVIKAALDLKGHIPPEDFNDLRKEALNEAGNIVDVDQEDLRKLMGNKDGMSLMLWIMIERRYAQAVTRAQCLKAVEDGKVTEDQLIGLANQLLVAMGFAAPTVKDAEGGELGNVKGQGGGELANVPSAA